MAANDMRMEKEWTAAGKGCQTGTNQRSRTVAFLIVAVVTLAAVTVAGILTEDYAVMPVYQKGRALVIHPEITGIAFHNGGIDDYRHMHKA